MYRQMTNASHAAHAAMHDQVTAPSVLVAQVVIVLQHHAELALPVRQWAPTLHPLMAATSRLKQLGAQLLVAKPRNPPLSASVKPRQLQQLTVPRLSNQSEQRRI